MIKVQKSIQTELSAVFYCIKWSLTLLTTSAKKDDKNASKLATKKDPKKILPKSTKPFKIKVQSELKGTKVQKF
jgi:hypothetical protein